VQCERYNSLLKYGDKMRKRVMGTLGALAGEGIVGNFWNSMHCLAIVELPLGAKCRSMALWSWTYNEIGGFCKVNLGFEIVEL